jgi:hypothetical protein
MNLFTADAQLRLCIRIGDFNSKSMSYAQSSLVCFDVCYVISRESYDVTLTCVLTSNRKNSGVDQRTIKELMYDNDEILKQIHSN